MTTSASKTWMPTGRHELNIGTSLARALKARKGKGDPVKNHRLKPDREFYSFRYNFKPESVDSTRPGAIEIQAREEGQGSNVNVVRPSTQNDNGVRYVGTENSAREFECILIWDDETGTVTLEKVESNVVLTHDHKRVHVPRHVDSPAPAAPPRISASSSASSTQAPRQSAVRREQEEESEGEVLEPQRKATPRPATTQSKAKQPAPTSTPVPGPSAPAPTPQSIHRPAYALPAKPTPVPVASKPKAKAPAAPPPTSSAPIQAPSKKREPPGPTNADEETFEIRRPVQPPPLKKARIAAEKKAQQQQQLPPPSNFVLSLPDSSSQVSLPPPVPSAAPSQPVVTVPSDSEEDDDWVPVAAVTAPQPSAALPTRTIVMEEIEPSAFTPPPHAAQLPQSTEDNEGDEIDITAFEAELNGELGDPVPGPDSVDEEDDFLAVAVSPVERQPQSMTYGGNSDFVFGDDDEYSSSDESDDD